MELFAKLFDSLLVLVYHCFDRIVIHGYLSGLSRPEQVVYFFRHVLAIPVVDKDVLSRRTNDYQGWVEAYARNHHIPIQWAEKGVRKEDYVLPALRRMEKNNAFGVYLISRAWNRGAPSASACRSFPRDPNTHHSSPAAASPHYFYVRDEGSGADHHCDAGFILPLHATYLKMATLSSNAN
jgi:hypothetical protein